MKMDGLACIIHLAVPGIAGGRGLEVILFLLGSVRKG
jgi:hypothetical protein